MKETFPAAFAVPIVRQIAAVRCRALLHGAAPRWLSLGGDFGPSGSAHFFSKTGSPAPSNLGNGVPQQIQTGTA